MQPFNVLFHHVRSGSASLAARPVTRSLFLLAGGTAIVVISGLFVEAVISASQMGAEAYDDGWYPEADEGSKTDRVSTVNMAFSEQFDAIMAKSATPHVGSFLDPVPRPGARPWRRAGRGRKDVQAARPAFRRERRERRGGLE